MSAFYMHNMQHMKNEFTSFPLEVFPVGFNWWGCGIWLAEHLMPRRKLHLKIDPFSALV